MIKITFVFLLPLKAPDSTSGVISKTIDICLHKEGNSFGFVMRGTCPPKKGKFIFNYLFQHKIRVTLLSANQRWDVCILWIIMSYTWEPDVLSAPTPLQQTAASWNRLKLVYSKLFMHSDYHGRFLFF